LNPSGRAFVYSTYFGGLNDESGKGIAVDPLGNAYIVGNTKSFNLTTTADALQSIYGDVESADFYGDGFVAKIGPGGTLSYSTYLGGSGEDDSLGIAVDSKGDIYVTGETDSPNYPLANPLQPDLNDDSSFIVKILLSPDGLPKPPSISSAMVEGKKLIVMGEGFDEGAVILLDGVEQPTTNDPQSPAVKLMSKKAGKKVKPGQAVMIQIRNSDGTLSQQYNFLRAVN
jgi:hypothetical protein